MITIFPQSHLEAHLTCTFIGFTCSHLLLIQTLIFLLSPGNVVLHYRRYMTDKWLPNCEDTASYLSEEDKHGILVFKASDQCNS